MNKCGNCDKNLTGFNRYVCARCSNLEDEHLQKQLNRLKKDFEGLEIWVNELLERLAVQLANDSFRALKREES